MNGRNGALTIALTGQPNVGKSTVFNVLTGLNQYVSNWPGKTCEQRIGSLNHNGLEIQVVDLPGTYSLTANSVEEQIARDYIIQGQPDVVAAVVDAASLERNLYLLAELLSLPSPLVLGLNFLLLTDLLFITKLFLRILVCALKLSVCGAFGNPSHC